ncbi:Uncharacterised protein [Burkholderia pseudomallei]|nr:Uncharacterised protein [Burkholderia pseudomallei]
MFDAIEKAFHDVPGPIQHAAIATLGLPVRTRRDYGLRTRSADALYKGVRVVALVGDDGPGAQMLNQFIRARNIGDLPLGGNQPQGPPCVIDGQVQLVRQSTLRATERLRTVFFRAPDECWCARTMVESINTCLISVSSATAWITRSHTPLRRHLESACTPYAIVRTPSANRATGSRSGQSREPLRQTSDCRPPFFLGRLPCPARQIRFVPIPCRSVTFESS